MSILAVFVSVITLAMYLKVQRFTFFNKSGEDWDKRGVSVREVPFAMCFSMIFLAVLCLVLSLLIIPSVRNIIITPAVDVLINAGEYSTAILGY